jgi:MYXO-CTERM domain-containing protein
VNIGTNPVAGDVVASHYIGFDPASGLGQVGYIDFDADIYGVATDRTKLNDSDFVANTGVTYLSDSLRGLEGGDSVMIDPTNSRRLLVNWFANSPGDYVRVFTQFSAAAVSAPPVAGFLLLGIGLLAARRRVSRRVR